MDPESTKAFLKKHVQWDLFFSVVKSLEKSLNSPKLRFYKSDLLELSLEIFSEKKLVWVDQKGWDFEISESDGSTTRIEMKFSENSLRTKKRRNHKAMTSDIRMQNTLGNNEYRDYSAKFDFLIVCDLDAIALFSKSEVELHARKTGDAFVAKLPLESKHMVTTPSSGTDSQKVTVEKDFKSLIYETMLSYLGQFKK